MKFLRNKSLLITGGTGSFGHTALETLTDKYKLKKIIVFSRDENKQFEMRKKFPQKNIRFFLGDVRDEARLTMALQGIDYVIHAAAQKQVPAAEYNPFECIKTNINGAQSVITASIKNNVKKVIALSTDKACNPINLYGATKLCAEKLFVNANQLSPMNGTRFSVVRYGNVIASRGSVIPFFKDLINQGKKELPLTHSEMSRFFITLSSAVSFVFDSLKDMKGGEISIPKMNSIYIRDLIKFLDKKIKIKIIGTRPGEKVHEILCSKDETRMLYDYKNSFIIFPEHFLKKNRYGRKVKTDFFYASNSKNCLSYKKISSLIQKAKI